jgi:hypothetical protein
VPGPTGCFGCTGESLPAVWNFETDFDVIYTGNETVVTSNSTTYPILADVYTGLTPPAVATVNNVMPTNVTSKPLIANLGVLGTRTCFWSNGAYHDEGWIHLQNYAAVMELTEKRFTVTGSGPWVDSLGRSSAGSAGSPCYSDLSTFDWPTQPEFTATPPLSTDGVAGPFTTPPYNYYVFPLRLCWNWALRQTFFGATNSISLYLTINGYRTVSTDRLVKLTATPYYGNTFPCGTTGTTRNAALSVLFGALTISSQGAARWTATYPCGNPERFTLTKVSQTGALSSATLPSTVTLVRGL